MSWSTEIVQILRVLIDDLESSPTYSDDRLKQIITVSARFVVKEIPLSNTYTITISDTSPDISPDPTLLSTPDLIFIDLVALKSACLIDKNKLRSEALLAGIRARCGPTMLETLERTKAFKDLIEIGPCASYEELKTQISFGGTLDGKGGLNSKAILSPFISNNYQPFTGSDRR